MTPEQKETAARLADDQRQHLAHPVTKQITIAHLNWRNEVVAFLRTLSAQPDDAAAGDIVQRIEREPENDKPGLMEAFDEIVTGPVDMVHIERMSASNYWMGIYRGDKKQTVVIHSANNHAKLVARTEGDT